MDSIINLVMAALNPLQLFIMRLLDLAPVLIGSFVLLLAGMLLGHYVRQMVDRLFNIIRVDEYARRIGVPRLLERLGLGTSLTKLSGIVAYALIIVSFVLAAADVLGLVVVSAFLGHVVGFMPKLVAVVIILGGGLFLGSIMGRIVFRSASANHVKGADALSKGTYGLFVILSGLFALPYLGIDIGILRESMTIIVGSIGLGCAIAFGVSFGMAGRDVAGQWIRDLTPRHGTNGRNGMMVIHHHGKKRAKAA